MKLTLDELNAKLDDVLATEDKAERDAKGVELKLDMRLYKEERDKTEEENNAKITALNSEIDEHKDTIEKLRTSNENLADKYGKILLKEDMKKEENEENETNENIKYTIDELVNKEF